MEFDVKSASSLLGQSALQAFRSDLPLGGSDTDADDEAAILVATLLRQQFSIPEEDPARARLISRAIGLAVDSLGQEALDEGCSYDEHPSRTEVDIVRRLVQRTEHKGWLRLTQHLLESAAGMVSDPVEQGRVLADRVRNSRKQGQLDLSLAQAEELGRLAHRIRSNELLARFYSANGAYAQTRGNLVDLRKNAEVVLRLTKRSGLRRLMASGHAGLAIVEARAGRHSEAVAHFWAAYRTVGSTHIVAEEALGNLAQTLMLSGRAEEARKIACLKLGSTRRPQSMLPTLGTYVVCSARLRDLDAVHWAVGKVESLANGKHFPREVAEALIECAIALEIIGHESRAGVLRRRAETLARSFGFHDLTFEESLVIAHGQPPERPAFKGLGAKAEREIAEMAVPRIPEVELVGA